ncbi:MAG: PAS domain S-box protein [Desulfosalsimonadaceae bacterium]
MTPYPFVSPKKLLIYTTLFFFVTEILIMLILHTLGPYFPAYAGIFIDAILLTLFGFPALYYFLFKPMMAHISKRKDAEEELHFAYAQLEKKVAQRTAQLTETSEKLQAEMKERQQAIAVMTENEERYRGLIESLNDAVVVINTNREIILWNPAAAKTFGYTKTEALGQPIEIIIPESFREKYNAHIGQFLNQGHHQTAGGVMVVEGLRKDCTVLPVELSLSAVRRGSSYEITGIMRDISRRERVEAELRRSHDTQSAINKLLSLSLQNVPLEALLGQTLDLILSIPWLTIESKGGIFIINNDPNMLILRAQRGFEKPLQEKCAKVPIGTCLCGRAALLKETVFASRIDERHDVRFEGMTDHGHYCLPILSAGRTLGVLNVYVKEGHPHDTREEEFLTAISNTLAGILIRRQTEEEKTKIGNQLRQSQKMEAVGTLAGGIAHDFNNILTAVIGYTELALDDAGKGSLVEDNLHEVFKAAKRARDLVKQILAYARQTDNELKPTQVSIIVKEALKLLRSSLPSTIDIRQDIRSESLAMADPSQIHQIIMNLCTNAAHAMADSDSGTMAIALSDILLEDKFLEQYPELQQGHYLKLAVSDTGIGMGPDILPSIFEPYFTTKEPGEGTGLGLAVIQGIVKSHGGEITVESAPGKGSVFTVYLPILKQRTGVAPAVSEPLPTGHERILLIDDESAIVNMQSKQLTKLGYSVTTRTSGIEALELFRNKPDAFDLVITDMTMPHMTGDKLAIELIKIRPDIPVILCSGYSRKISDEAAEKIGVTAFLLKPLILQKLAETVRRVLDGNHIAEI